MHCIRTMENVKRGNTKNLISSLVAFETKSDAVGLDHNRDQMSMRVIVSEMWTCKDKRLRE